MKKHKRKVVNLLKLLLLVFISSTVYSQEYTAVHISESLGKPVINYEQIIYALVFLVIMVLGAIFLIKKSKFNGTGTTGFIDIVYNYAITSKDKLLIAKVGDEYLLLGMSSSGINKLHEINKEIIQRSMSENNIKTNDFANILVNLIGKHRND